MRPTRSKPGGFVAARARKLALRSSALAVAGCVAAAVAVAKMLPILALVALGLLLVSSIERRRARRWRAGGQAERTVARQLQRLTRRGWVVAHDIDRGAGNVDHVAIGPRGAFAIETKTARIDAHGLAQARSNAAWTAGRLGVPVMPILVVVRRRQRPRLVGGVICVDQRRLRRTLRRQRTAAISVEHVARRLA